MNHPERTTMKNRDRERMVRRSARLIEETARLSVCLCGVLGFVWGIAPASGAYIACDKLLPRAGVPQIHATVVAVLAALFPLLSGAAVGLTLGRRLYFKTRDARELPRTDLAWTGALSDYFRENADLPGVDLGALITTPENYTPGQQHDADQAWERLYRGGFPGFLAAEPPLPLTTAILVWLQASAALIAVLVAYQPPLPDLNTKVTDWQPTISLLFVALASGGGLAVLAVLCLILALGATHVTARRQLRLRPAVKQTRNTPSPLAWIISWVLKAPGNGRAAPAGGTNFILALLHGRSNNNGLDNGNGHAHEERRTGL
jgi:hypothetical protein